MIGFPPLPDGKTLMAWSGYLNVMSGSNSALYFSFYGSLLAKSQSDLVKYPTISKNFQLKSSLVKRRPRIF